MGSNYHGRALTQTILAMADSLWLEVVAEGVESHKQVDVLKSMGCAMAEGFLLGKPLAAEDTAGRLTRDKNIGAKRR